MDDERTGSGLLRRGWLRLIDGDRPWGSIDIRPDRFGVTRYRLVVYPPGISESERRRVRAARGWPLWGALVWVVGEIWLSHVTGPWTAAGDLDGRLPRRGPGRRRDGRPGAHTGAHHGGDGDGGSPRPGLGRPPATSWKHSRRVLMEADERLDARRDLGGRA